jgi:hypothetical protein
MDLHNHKIKRRNSFVLFYYDTIYFSSTAKYLQTLEPIPDGWRLNIWKSLLFQLSPYRHVLGEYLKTGHDHSLHVISNSSF